MSNNKVKIEAFHIIGIAVRTSNANGQSATDIGNLWNKFMSDGILAQIPNKVSNEIYAIYTHYAGDYTQPYTTILGCRVKNLDAVPEGMVAQSIVGGDYIKFTAKGDLTKGAVYDEWQKIWQMDLDRAYTADFEIYGEKAQNPTDAEVDIFISMDK